MTIGIRIKNLRIKAGMNQTDLANYLGVTQGIVSSIEKSGNKLTLSHAMKLSELFGVSTDYLLFGKLDAANMVEKDILSVVRSDRGIFDAMVNLVNSRRHVQQLAV
jgi:transcriptional regulator with XRE-family HTH domain